ncbi:serine/threonine protein kinase [Actinomycetales bacterium JB111]|nr:serine/threonine protein kinase [Actinomycetales bacterium JB111]
MPTRPLGSRYRLDAEIGRGAMGSVWSGSRNDNGERVAVKLLRSEYAEDAEIVSRFIQERSVLLRVVHPNVVRVRDLVVEGSTLGIVMEHIGGGDVRRLLDSRGTLPPAEAAWLGREIALGLAAIHAEGIIHRDVKPANILLDDSGDGTVPKVSDFGVARITQGTGHTTSTAMLGTPLYMAPEVIEEETPTGRADVYALGIMLYEMVAGITPFAGAGGAYGVLTRHSGTLPGRPDGFPDALWDLVLTMLAKDPALRPDAGDVAERLGHLGSALDDLPALRKLVEAPVGQRLPTGQWAGAADGTVQDGASATTALAGTGPATAAPDGTVVRDGAVAPDGTVVAGAPGVGPTTHPGAAAQPGPGHLPVGYAPEGSGAGWATSERGDAPPTRSRGGRLRGPRAVVAAFVAGAVLATALVLGIRLLTGGGPMPDLAGLTVDQAEEALGDDVGIEERSVLSDGDPVGTIVAQHPATGAGTPGTVTVTVAEESTLRSLDELGSESADGELRETYERVSIDGASTDGAVVSGGFDTDGSTTYALEEGFDRLRGLVGRLDGGDSPSEDSRGERASRGGAGVEVEIYGDDVLIASQVVDVGSPWRLDLDVSGVDELRIDYYVLDTSYAYVAIGDGRVIGQPANLPERYA